VTVKAGNTAGTEGTPPQQDIIYFPIAYKEEILLGVAGYQLQI
jgi:hypothetical protein